jgi:hypothetical protein
MGEPDKEDWRYATVIAATDPNAPENAPIIGRIHVSQFPNGPWREATAEEAAQIERDFPEQLKRFSAQ